MHSMIFFVSICTDLANKITSTVNPMTYISNIENSIFVPDVTENDVWNLKAQLKNSSAGWDHFPAIIAIFFFFFFFFFFPYAYFPSAVDLTLMSLSTLGRISTLVKPGTAHFQAGQGELSIHLVRLCPILHYKSKNDTLTRFI